MTGTFKPPKNMPPGIMILKITNNYLKNPNVMLDLRVIEYLKLPEIHSLLPD